jgi:hypothetical protein
VPKRSSLRARLDQDQDQAARGQEAVYGQPETPAPAGLPGGPPVATAATWEATHQRVTFYCPLELLEAVEAEMRRTGRSKTGVIVDALKEHLDRP